MDESEDPESPELSFSRFHSYSVIGLVKAGSFKDETGSDAEEAFGLRFLHFGQDLPGRRSSTETIPRCVHRLGIDSRK